MIRFCISFFFFLCLFCSANEPNVVSQAVLGTNKTAIAEKETAIPEIPKVAVPEGQPSPLVPQKASVTEENGTSSIFSHSKVFHFASNEDLTDVIRDFCTLEDLDAVISDKVSGKVNRRYKNLDPKDFWEELTQSYGLIWFFDGTIMYVYSGSETQSKVLKLPPSKIDPLLEIVTNFNFASSKISIRAVKGAGIVFISGPPKFIETVEDISTKMTTVLPEEKGKVIVKVFPLKYAWAADTAYGGTNIPGIASQLRSLLGQKSVDNFALSTVNTDLSHRAEAMDGVLKKKVERMEKEASEPDKPKKQEESDLMGLSGNITIDPRLNALIVKDYEGNMDRYQEIIDVLDCPVRLIEITAAMIDINKNAGLNLGVDSIKQSEGKRLNTLTFTPTSTDTEVASGSASTVAAKFTSIVDSMNFDLSLTALESEGVAHVISRPSVATLDNIEASLTSSETFYVKVAGDYASDLYPISSDTLLKVTPHVINETNGKYKIKLMLTVQDSSSEADATTSNPSVKNTTVVTQAVLNERQSLLLGGYLRENITDHETGVPILRHIPILGLLFKKMVKSSYVRERMFLITPRIVELSSGEDKYKEYMETERKHGDSVLKNAENNPVAINLNTI